MSSKGRYSSSTLGIASSEDSTAQTHSLSLPTKETTTSSFPATGSRAGPRAKVFPVTPLTSSRYDRVPDDVSISTGQRPKLPKGRHRCKGRSLNEIIYAHRTLPPGWEQYVHLDGKPYFRDSGRRILTEANIADPILRARIDQFYGYLQDRLTNSGVDDLGEDYELYVELDVTEEDKVSYYYVDHDTKDVFWLDDIDLEQYGLMTNEEPGDTNYDMFIMRNYYRHLENFPCHTNLPPDAAPFLHGVLTYTCADHMTSRESATTPWNAEHAKQFLELFESLEASYEKQKGNEHYDSSYRTWFVARLLCVVLHSRSVHRHGMLDARTDRLMSIEHGPAGFQHLAFGAFAFYAHLTYMQRLENVWADGIVSFNGWQALLKSLLAEWSDSNLLATVTLSANMAFLALNDIEMVSIMFSIISTFLAMGSIAIGLHHVWRHRDKQDSNAEQAGIYFRNASSWTGTLTPLAISLSLPLILLSWSLVAFAASVSVYSFMNPRPVVSYGLTGAIMVAVICAVLWITRFFFKIFVPRSHESA